MRWVIVFDRSTGTVLELNSVDGDDPSGGGRIYAAAEEKYFGRLAVVEVVALEAPTLDALRRSHARYFKRLEDIATELTDGSGRSD